MPDTVVVQYVPDAVMNERINIGVIVLHDGKARSVFLGNWHRVKQFSGEDGSFLKEVERDSRVWDEPAVRRLSSQWTGSVQFSPPRFTMLSPDEALIDGVRRYLFERSSAAHGYRDKTDTVRLVRSRIREKLMWRFGTVGKALLRDNSYALRGEHLAYKCDVSVGNGGPYFAAQGISFEVPHTRRLDKEIASTAWLIEDVKRLMPDFPIAVAVLPPKSEGAAAGKAPSHGGPYDDAMSLFDKLGARIVPEAGFSGWAEEMVNDLPYNLRRQP